MEIEVMKKCRSDEEGKCGLNLVKLMSVFLVLSILFWGSAIVLTDTDSHTGLWEPLVQARNLYYKLKKAIPILDDAENEKLLGNLLPTGFDEKACVSQYRLPLYWRGDAHKPSPHLISKLRSYEARHRRCGPNTESYNKTLQLLQSDTYIDNQTGDCKYIVWIPFEGLGNMMLSLASAFLYALLTDRVVLIARTGADIPGLFCEPFPGTSWFLPLDFPLDHQFTDFNQQSNYSYGNQLRTNSIAPTPYMYVFLANNCDDQDKLFFCDQHHTYLHHIPWLILKTDQYIAPLFFLMPSFQQELHALFPEKETVFHLLGRYLFHPTNSVWGLITRFYEAYLSKADVVAAIQVRQFFWSPPLTEDQILSCIKTENILPQIRQLPKNSSHTTTTKVAVVMVSLSSNFFERIRDMYWENAAEKGEVVGVFQPSHEENQQTGKLDHDRKALAEIYLLSLTDREKLVTSGWSTFGYVGQALGGLKPWILYRPEKESELPNPACGRGVSLEPCYHTPPHLDCKTREGIDMGGVVPHVRHCEDYPSGLKLF